MKKKRRVVRTLAVFLVIFTALSLSLFLYVKNNIASVVNKIIEMKKGDDSPWSFSFGEIIVKDNTVVLEDFSLYYETTFIVSLDEITLDKSPSSLYDFWKNEGSCIRAEIHNGRVNLSSALASYDDYRKRENKTAFSFYEFLTSRNIDIEASDISIEYDSLEGKCDSILLSYSESDGILRGSFLSEKIYFSDGEYSGSIEDCCCLFGHDGEITFTFDAEYLSLSSSSSSLSMLNMTLSESTASLDAFLKNDYEAALYFSSGAIGTGDYSLSSLEGDFLYSDEVMRGEISNLELLSEKAVINSPLVSLTLDTEKDYSICMPDVSVVIDNCDYALSSGIITGNLDLKVEDISFSSSYGDLTELTGGKIGKVTLSSLHVFFPEGRANEFNLSSSATLETSGSFLSDIEMDIKAEFSNEDGESECRIELSRIYPGFGRIIPSVVVIEGSLPALKITMEGENISLSLLLNTEEEKAEGTLRLDELLLKSALEWILDKEIQSLTKTSKITMDSYLDISPDSDGEMECSADFSIMIDPINFSLFTLNVTIAGKAKLSRDRFDLENVVLSSPLFSFSVTGWYDFVTRTPHFQFNR